LGRPIPALRAHPDVARSPDKCFSRAVDRLDQGLLVHVESFDFPLSNTRKAPDQVDQRLRILRSKKRLFMRRMQRGGRYTPRSRRGVGGYLPWVCTPHPTARRQARAYTPLIHARQYTKRCVCAHTPVSAINDHRFSIESIRIQDFRASETRSEEHTSELQSREN